MWRNICIFMAVENMKKKVKTFTIFGEMWAGSLSFIVVDFYLFTRIWISDMQITQRRT